MHPFGPVAYDPPAPSFARNLIAGWPLPTERCKSPLVPRPPELLFMFRRGEDQCICELRYPGSWGVEATFLLNGEPFVGQRFDTREQAVQWAKAMHSVIQKGGVP